MTGANSDGNLRTEKARRTVFKLRVKLVQSRVNAQGAGYRGVTTGNIDRRKIVARPGRLGAGGKLLSPLGLWGAPLFAASASGRLRCGPTAFENGHQPKQPIQGQRADSIQPPYLTTEASVSPEHTDGSRTKGSSSVPCIHRIAFLSTVCQVLGLAMNITEDQTSTAFSSLVRPLFLRTSCGLPSMIPSTDRPIRSLIGCSALCRSLEANFPLRILPLPSSKHTHAVTGEALTQPFRPLR